MIPSTPRAATEVLGTGDRRNTVAFEVSGTAHGTPRVNLVGTISRATYSRGFPFTLLRTGVRPRIAQKDNTTYISEEKHFEKKINNNKNNAVFL